MIIHVHKAVQVPDITLLIEHYMHLNVAESNTIVVGVHEVRCMAVQGKRPAKRGEGKWGKKPNATLFRMRP